MFYEMDFKTTFALEALINDHRECEGRLLLPLTVSPLIHFHINLNI